MEAKEKLKSNINNAFYDQLKELWYKSGNHPVALLRQESKLLNPWIIQEIEKEFGTFSRSVLDIGCGGGFLSNALAEKGHTVTGIDLSQESLDIAKQYDATNTASYLQADAKMLPFEENSFDIATAMDFLEHIEDPKLVIAEVSRVLKPGGLFFFHTFNKNFFSWLIVIKGIEWFVQNTPKNMHVYDLFIDPKDLTEICSLNRLNVKNLNGIRPAFRQKALWKLLSTRQVPEDFNFIFTSSLLIAYAGVAIQV